MYRMSICSAINKTGLVETKSILTCRRPPGPRPPPECRVVFSSLHHNACSITYNYMMTDWLGKPSFTLYFVCFFLNLCNHNHFVQKSVMQRPIQHLPWNHLKTTHPRSLGNTFTIRKFILVHQIDTSFPCIPEGLPGTSGQILHWVIQHLQALLIKEVDMVRKLVTCVKKGPELLT